MAKQRELPVHVAILDYLRAVLVDAVVFHPANGGARDARTGALMKRLGVLPGIPDLVILHDGGKATFIEVKASKGAVSKSQIELHGKIRGLGFNVAVLRSVDDARNMLRALNIATREAA